jgi:hypothetical protein
MPKIPTYERRGQLPVSYQQGLDSRERAAFTLGSQGTAETGKDIREAASIAYKWNEQQKKEKASLDMALVSSEMGERFSMDFENLTNQEERDVGKYRNKDLTQRYDGSPSEGRLLVDLTRDAVDKLINSKDYATIAEGNKYFAAEFEKFSLRFREVAMSKAIQQQSQFHIQAVEVGIQDGLEKAAAHVSNSPTQLDGTMMMWRTVLGDMPQDKIPESMKGLTAVGVKPEGADKYLAIARPAVLQKAKENLNKVAEVAFLRMIADDPAAAHKALRQLGATSEGKWKLENLYGFTGDQYLRLLNSSKTSSEFVNVKARYELDRQLEDAISAAKTGTVPAGFTKLEDIQAKVYSVLDPNDPKSKEQAYVVASKAHREITVNQKIFGIAGNFSKMSNDEIARTVKNLKPVGVNAADEEKIQQGVAQMANSVLTERQNDQAAHYKNNPIIIKLREDGKYGEANDNIIAAQRRNGTPDHELTLLSKADVETEKSYLTGTSGEQLGQRLRSFVERHGGKNGERRGDLQIVWRQLTTGPNPLPTEYIWAANAMGTAAEPQIIKALSTKLETIKNNLGSLQTRGVSWSILENSALTIGDPYRRALTGNVPDRLNVYDSARALAVRMAAMNLATTGSNNMNQALRDAFKVVMQGYDLDGGTYYIQTKMIGGTGTSLNTKLIHANAERVRTDQKLLTSLDSVLAPGSMNPGNKDPAYRQKQYLEILEKRSYWINNANGTGLQLVVDANGIIEPVVNNQGNPYELTWQQLNNPTLLPQKKSSWFGVEFK